jgi:hypothetical protein
LHWNPWNHRTNSKKALAHPYDGRHVGTTAFPPAARIPAKGRGPNTIYRASGKHKTKKHRVDSRGTERPTYGGGGRGGASPFPAMGRRTRANKGRMSTSGSPGNCLSTWTGQRPSERSCRREDRAQAAPAGGGSG